MAPLHVAGPSRFGPLMSEDKGAVCLHLIFQNTHPQRPEYLATTKPQSLIHLRLDAILQGENVTRQIERAADENAFRSRLHMVDAFQCRLDIA